MSRRLALLGCALFALSGCGSSSKAGTTIPGTTTRPARVTVARLQVLQFGRSVQLRPISGAVGISEPASGGTFTPLTGTRLVPVGTTVDTRRGVVQVTTALPGHGTDVGVFQQGTFKVAQSRSAGGLTDLTVLDQRTVASACGGAGGHRKLSPFQLGVLLGSAHRGFRTDGEFASAAVLGTSWGTRNRCDGTLTVDRQGVVLVTVYHPHRTITLHTGQTFLARAA